MIFSNILRESLPSASVNGFLRRGAYQHLRGAASTLLRRGRLARAKRTTDKVLVSYDESRAQIAIETFDKFVIGERADDFAFVGGELVYGDPNRATVARMQTLVDRITRYAGSGAIVEIGSGAGRNLLYLARSGVKNPLIGLELSPVSVALARRAAARFGHEIRFEPCDVTKDWPDLGPVDVVFSVHAFEMMPRIFKEGLANAAKLDPRAYVFFEPIEEFWPRMSASCLIARLRVRQLDRLRGFRREALRLGAQVEGRFLGDAMNPFNPTSLMIVENKNHPETDSKR